MRVHVEIGAGEDQDADRDRRRRPGAQPKQTFGQIRGVGEHRREQHAALRRQNERDHAADRGELDETLGEFGQPARAEQPREPFYRRNARKIGHDAIEHDSAADSGRRVRRPRGTGRWRSPAPGSFPR